MDHLYDNLALTSRSQICQDTTRPRFDVKPVSGLLAGELPRRRRMGRRLELVTGSPAQYWKLISEHIWLAVAAIQQVDKPARERIRAYAIANVSAFEKDGKVRVPGVARCIVGTKHDASGTRQGDGERSSNAG